MRPQLYLFLLWFFIYLLPCEGEGHVLIHQTPRWVTGQLGEAVKMKCYQNNTDHGWMYWYQQKKAEEKLGLIGILMEGTPEPVLQEGFTDGRFMIKQEYNRQ